MSAFRYEPLNVASEEIRLVTLLPGGSDDQIELRIGHAPLKHREIASRFDKRTESAYDEPPPGWSLHKTLEGRRLFVNEKTSRTSWYHPDAPVDSKAHQDDIAASFVPDYEALSYTWGTPDLTTRVSIDVPKEQCKTSMWVTTNLAAALRQLRYTHSPRVLWIDALSINQGDFRERSDQVKRMRYIYAWARRVVIWLGPKGQHSSHAIASLKHLSDQVEYTRDSWCCGTPDAQEPTWFNPEVPLPWDEHTWSSIQCLLKRSWFHRVWVLQEAQLGNSDAFAQCGDDSITWPALRRALLVLAEKADLPLEIYSILKSYRSGILARGDGEFRQLTSWARNRHCSNPRDKIYGIVGLLSTKYASELHPDYSLSTAQVYINSTRSWIMAMRSLSVLEMCNSDHRFPGTPSWVPNFDRPTSYRRAIRGSSSGASRAYARFIAPSTLEVAGRRCGIITSVGKTVEGITEDLHKTVKHWEPPDLHTAKYVSGEPMLDAFMDLIAQGARTENFPSHNYLSLEELKQWYEDGMLADTSRNSRLSYYARGLEQMALINTTGGHIGIASPSAKPGDVIYAFLGCSCLIVLRPTSPDPDPDHSSDSISNSYQVIGNSSIVGLGNCETLLGPLPSDCKVEFRRSEGDRRVVRYRNTRTQELSMDDPRLVNVPLPEPWMMETKGASWNVGYKNQTTGETRSSDPRMDVQALRARGVEMEMVMLE